ncbi:dynactin subunit 1-like [Rhopilema esculentum]|uniref:dynactin subunit 1-like n=1 Tax=Rhopilema esculentum TaxID=499914 RepID=UPI0031DA665F|eukprot:gene12012-2596_t
MAAASGTPAAGGSLKIGTKVEVIGKGLVGTVQYSGMTAFASGKWIGVALDEPKGKNDGTVQQKRYFTCPPNHGIFVRQSQLAVLSDVVSKEDEGRSGASSKSPDSSASLSPSPSPSPTQQMSRLPGKSGLVRPGFGKKAVGQEELKPKQEKSEPAVAPPTPQPTASIPTSQPASTPIPTPIKSAVPEPASKLDVQSPMTSSRSTAASEELTELHRKLIEKDKAVIDLEEKLATLKQKRAEDKNKLKEVEKLKMQNQQLTEYKTRWQETQKELLHQLRTSQKEAREAREELAKHSDDSVDLQEAVEMATLDKEMAEEKCESLQAESESLKERIEELTLELEILRNEISDGGVEGVAANAEVKKYEQQNTRLKEAIVKMKEISVSDKTELQQLQKQFKEMSNQLSEISAERDKLQSRLQVAEESIDELKEQVDTALGAEEMVETLTDKNLALEEEIDKLQETVADLEALRDLNEELEENHLQTEHDLREELDMTMNKKRELDRKLDATHETIADYQGTITKFRDLVNNLQIRIHDLQQQQQDQSAESDQALLSQAAPEIDFKIKFAEIKQHARGIELELRKFEVQEANEHVKMLSSYLPDYFSRRGGDYDGVLLLLLLSRLNFKTELLSNQLREKHDIGEIVDDGQPLKGSRGDLLSHATQMTMLLYLYQKIIAEYTRAAGSCDVSVFTRIAAQYPELAADEKYIDHYLNLLTKDELDDTVSLEPLEKAVKHFTALYSLHLGNFEISQTEFLNDAIRIISSGAECLSMDTQRLRSLAATCDEGSKFINFLASIELRNMEVKQLCKKIKRRMPPNGTSVIEYPKEVMGQIDSVVTEQTNLVKMVQELANVSSYKASSLAEGEVLLSGQLEESAWDCVMLVYEKDDCEPIDCISEGFKKILLCLSGVSIKLQEGEYDAEPPSKMPEQPYLIRAKAFKEELSITTKLEEKIEAKEQEMLEIRMAMKLKAEELSAANIRIGLLEKRADNAANDADAKVEAVNKKYDNASNEHAQKTKEYEETLDCLQADIVSLEKENQDLKKRLDAYSKKTLLTDIARQAQGGSGIASLVGSPTKSGGMGKGSVQVIIKDSPVILAQLESLKTALSQVRAENIRLKAKKLKDELAALPKIYSPPACDESHRAEDSDSNKTPATFKTVTKDTTTLLNNLQALSVCPKVVDITKRKPGSELATGKAAPMNQFIETKNLLMAFKRQKEELQKNIQSVITKELPGAAIASSCKQFYSPEYSKVIEERSRPVLVGRLSFPSNEADTKATHRKVLLTPQQFTQLHAVMAR